MLTLGKKIRALRMDRDMSLRELAKKVEMSPSFLSDIELGNRHPSDKYLVRIADLLEINVQELQTHDSRPPIDALKRKTEDDPQFGFAFRQLIDTGITSDEILEVVKKRLEK